MEKIESLDQMELMLRGWLSEILDVPTNVRSETYAPEGQKWAFVESAYPGRYSFPGDIWQDHEFYEDRWLILNTARNLYRIGFFYRAKATPCFKAIGSSKIREPGKTSMSVGGPFEKATWEHILREIIKNELQSVSPADQLNNHLTWVS